MQVRVEWQIFGNAVLRGIKLGKMIWKYLGVLSLHAAK